MLNGCHPILTHLGVGDGIVQSGLAVALLDRYERLGFPAYPENVATFTSVFKASTDRIKVYPVPRLLAESYGSPRYEIYEAALRTAGLPADPDAQIRLGVYAGRGVSVDFSRDFYVQADIPYEARWSRCPIEAAWPAVEQFPLPSAFPPPGRRRFFVHDDPSRNFRIDRARLDPAAFLVQAQSGPNTSILRYAAYLIEADEIHVIDSAFLWLVDALPVKGRLFLHRYARWERPREFRYEMRHAWHYLD
jgi:hypothetical protein